VTHPSNGPRKPLLLTQEEAISLLEMCLYSCEETDALQAAAMHRLADFCRDFFSDEVSAEECEDDEAVEHLMDRRGAIAACG